jgi:hypothetical protein
MSEPEIREEGLKPENKATRSRIKEIQEILEVVCQGGLFILSNLNQIVDLTSLGLIEGLNYGVTTDGRVRAVKENAKDKIDEYLSNNKIAINIKAVIDNILENTEILHDPNKTFNDPKVFLYKLHLVLREVSEKAKTNSQWLELEKVLLDIINSENPNNPSNFYKSPESVEKKLRNLITELDELPYDQIENNVNKLNDLIRATLIMKEPFATLKDLSNVVNTIIENYQKICGNSGYLLDIKVKPKKPSAENSFYNFVKGRLGENCYLSNGYSDVTIRFVFISEGKNGKKYHRVFELQLNTRANMKAKNEETTNYNSRKENCNKINKILENYTKTTSKKETEVLEPEQMNWIMKGCMDMGYINTNGEIVKEVEFKNIITDCLENLGYDFTNMPRLVSNKIYELFLDYKDKFIESCKLFERTQRVIASEADVLAFTKLCEENTTHKRQILEILKPDGYQEILENENNWEELNKMYNEIKYKLEDRTTVNQV